MDAKMFLSKTTIFELKDNEGNLQKVEFELLGVEYLQDFYNLFNKMGTKDMTYIGDMASLISKWVKYNLPDLSEREVGQFGLLHFQELKNALINSHIPKINQKLDIKEFIDDKRKILATKASEKNQA